VSAPSPALAGPHRAASARETGAAPEVGEAALCGRRFTHPCLPTQFDALGYLVVEICVPPAEGHDHGCWCEHDIGR